MCIRQVVAPVCPRCVERGDQLPPTLRYDGEKQVWYCSVAFCGYKEVRSG